MEIDGPGYYCFVDHRINSIYLITSCTIFSPHLSGETELLLSAKTVFPDGKPALFLNDIEVTSEGIIYVTDSSYKWTRADHCYVGFENRPYAR